MKRPNYNLFGLTQTEVICTQEMATFHKEEKLHLLVK